MRPGFLLLFVLAGPSAGTAQPVVVHGVIRDSLTRRPVTNASICYWAAPRSSGRCVRADSTGAFRFDSVSPDSGNLTAGCELLPRGTRNLGTRSFGRPPSDTVRLLVASEGCDTRIARQINGVFAGHYSVGFEQSEFVPCPNATWYIPSDTAGVLAFRRNAWVSWPHGRDTPGTPKRWPKSKPVHPPWNYPQYYLRFSGVILGPGSYGHLGVSGFEAVVDSVIELRTPSRGDCRR